MVSLSAKQGLFYSLRGQGPVVLLLHGFLENHTMWSFTQGLEEHFTVLAVDLPGHGKSALVQNPQSMSSMADAVFDVLERLSIKKCAVVGHSMGGYVALEMANRQPNKVVSLSLFHSNPFADSVSKKKNRTKAARVVERNLSVFLDAAIPNLFTIQNQEKLSTTVDTLIRDAHTLEPNNVAACLIGMRDRLCFEDWVNSTPIPILMVAGKEDNIMPYKQLEGFFSMPNTTEGVVLDKVGHMGHLEDPKSCLTIYKRWLSSVFSDCSS